MYDIYTTDFILEQCSAEKQEINVLSPYTVIHFVLSGEGYINGKKVTENTAFIAYENAWMHYYPSKTKPWRYIFVRFKGDDLEKVFLHYGFDMDGVTFLPFQKQEALFKILSLHQELSCFDDFNARTAIANLVFLLFKENRQIQKNQNKQLQHVEEIKQYIEENFHRKITMEHIASKFFLNKNYIRTLFVKYLNISPKQYLQNLRMIRAETLLRSTDKDISLIASSVGYDDPLLFSKMFKHYHHVSPKQYRAKQ